MLGLSPIGMEWVSEWDTVMWTNLSSVLSSCNLKRKESFNEESEEERDRKEGGGKKEEGREEERKEKRE